MESNFPPSLPEPVPSILADLQKKIAGLPEAYREPIQADMRSLTAALASRTPVAGDHDANPIEQVLDSLIAGVMVIDHEGIVRMANYYAVSLFGFNPLGMTHEQFLIRVKAVGEDGLRVPNAQMPSSRAALGEVVPNEPLTITVPHGRKYHVLVSAMPLYRRGADGSEISGAACVWNDVTGQHNLEAEIRQQKELLETMLNASPFGMAILSGPDLRYRYTNRAFRSLSPDLANADGQPLRSVWRSEETYQRIKGIFERVVANGEPVQSPQEGIEQPDGTLRYFASHIMRITWEKQPAALLTLWDVTEMVTARTNLQRRAAEFQAIFEAISDVVLVFDTEGKPVRTNAASIAAFGFDPVGLERSELIRRLGLCHPDGNRLRMEDLISYRVLTTQQQVRDVPMQFQDAQGRARTIRASGSPLFDEAGKICGAVAVWHDVTEHVRQEQQILEINAALRHNQSVLDAFFAASPGVLLLLDQDLRFLKTDPQTPVYFGIEPEAIVGRQLGDLAPQILAETGPLMRQVLETGQPALNVEGSGLAPHPPGEIAYWRASYFPVLLPPDRRGLGVIAMNISEAKRLEKRVEESLARLRDCGAEEQ